MAILESGRSLGPYRIEKILGRGGMGEVYQAVDTRLGRQVAIKILPEHLASQPDALKRFQREAKALAALSHPNILSIHDVGTEGSISYVVTELLQGETLRQHLNQATIRWQRAADIGSAIAEGLAAAHSKGLIHRDLKPENIFLTSDDRVKILDFGLARYSVQESLEELSNVPTDTIATARGALLGTLPYMSPEQLRGETVDTRSDLFSVGCVLREMITGQHAFRRNSTAETTAAILKEDLPELTTPPLNLPHQLAVLISHCLKKNPEERLQSARDLAIALKAVQSTPTKPQAKVSRASKPPAQKIASLAVLPFVNVSTDPEMEYLSDGITESLMNNLAQLPNLKVISRSSVFRYKGAVQDPRSAGRELRVQAVLTGRVQQRGANLIISTELVNVRNNSHLWGEQYNKPLSDIFAIQEEIAREISQKLELKLTGKEQQLLLKRHTENTEAYHLYLKGRYYWNQRTPEGAQKGIQYFLDAVRKDPNYALAYAGLSDCYRALEQMDDARIMAMKALSMDQDLPEVRQCLGRIKFNHDYDWKGSEEEFKQAIASNPKYSEAHHSYSHYLVAMNRKEESLSESLLCLELEPIDSSLLTHLAWHYLMFRQYNEAIEQARKTLELESNYYPAHLYLGSSLVMQGKYQEAITEFIKSVELSQATNSKAALAHCYALAGQPTEARKILMEWNDPAKPAHFTSHEAAFVYVALREFDTAFEWLNRAYEQRAAELVYLNVDPIWDSIRGDARFTKLLQKMKLS